MEDIYYKETLDKLKAYIESFDISETPEEESLLLNFLKNLKLLTLGFEKVVPEFERLTVNKSLPENNNETINEISFLKNPPEDCINKYGRANLRNTSILYAAFCKPTTILENTPEKGDLVTISKWRAKKDNDPLIVYPVFDYFNIKDFQLKTVFNQAINRYSPELKDRFIADTCFIASCFSKKVAKGKEINYTLSAHLADKIFNEIYSGKIEAIIYPSVKDKADTNNIAMKPSVFKEKYELYEVTESRVLGIGNGEVMFQRIKQTTEFEDEIIKW